MGGVVAEQADFLSTAPASRKDRRIALAVIVASLLIFLSLAPFARQPLPQVWAFIPIYESAIAISDLVTAVILLIQFNILRSRALLALACGYLFTALMVVPHALTFPGLFRPTGLLGAGPNSTAWLYVFWHGGFPLAVISYALLKDRNDAAGQAGESARLPLSLSIGAVIGAVVGLTLLATVGKAILPDIMMGNNMTVALTVVVSTVCMLTLIALLILWRRRPHTVLDLWLMVVMCAWLFDVALSAVLNAGRFDLGFYAGRAYGLLAGTFVLVILLLETGVLYAKLAKLFEAEHRERMREAKEHRRTAAALDWHANRERLFSAAVQSSVDAILTVTLDGIITGWNPAAEQLFGFAVDEAIGKKVEIIVPDDRRAEAQSALARIRRGEIVEPYDTVRLTKDRTPVDVSISVSAIKSGEVVGLCAIARDVTQKKRLDRLKDEFVSTVSHELRTPLTSICGSLGLLMGNAAGDVSEPARRLLSIAQSNSQRLVKLVNDILDIEKLQSDQLVFKFRCVDVRSLIEQTIEANLGFADTYLVRLRRDIAADGEVWVDPDRLAQAVTNLISNAIKFSPPDGEVVVAVERRGENLRLTVRDHGVGIPSEFKPRVFQRFAQADGTDARKTGGTGLGLSIVKEIVGRLGGDVGFADAAGGGTIFYVDLPAFEQSRPVDGASLSTPALKEIA